MQSMGDSRIVAGVKYIVPHALDILEGQLKAPIILKLSYALCPWVFSRSDRYNFELV